MAESNEVNLPEDPYNIITVRWKEDIPVIVDLRGIEPGVAHMILQKAVDSIYDDYADPVIFYEDDDVISDEDLRILISSEDDDETS